MAVNNVRGTRDFFGFTLRKRQYIIEKIKSVFNIFGFEELETPALENTQTLMGKYGDEGDQLIYRVIDNGEIFESAIATKNKTELLNTLSSKALRYDLTIPFTRFAVMNYNQLSLPFKRFQIQPVWRGDKPQKGRYREFYQCDADIIGSNSLINEIELLNIYSKTFDALQLKQHIKICINSRKILKGLITKINAEDKEALVITIIDKLDKIGIEKVCIELQKNNLDENAIHNIQQFLNFKSDDNNTTLNNLKIFFEGIDIAQEGVKELEYIISYCNYFLIPPVIDVCLARGLSYYTGLIVEVKPTTVSIGSIGGGGRYDNLAETMGIKNLSGVGISFGIDRIYDVIEELQLFPSNLDHSHTQVLFFNMGADECKASYNILMQLREKNIKAEIFTEHSKLDKQFKYAEKKRIPYVIIIGTNELNNKTLNLKNLHTKENQTLFVDDFMNNLSQYILF